MVITLAAEIEICLQTGYKHNYRNLIQNPSRPQRPLFCVIKDPYMVGTTCLRNEGTVSEQGHWG